MRLRLGCTFPVALGLRFPKRLSPSRTNVMAGRSKTFWIRVPLLVHKSREFGREVNSGTSPLCRSLISAGMSRVNLHGQKRPPKDRRELGLGQSRSPCDRDARHSLRRWRKLPCLAQQTAPRLRRTDLVARQSLGARLGALLSIGTPIETPPGRLRHILLRLLLAPPASDDLRCHRRRRFAVH